MYFVDNILYLTYQIEIMTAQKFYSIIKPTFYALNRPVIILLLLLLNVTAQAQIMQLEVLGGAVVSEGSTITINAGASLDFRITNIETGNCKNLKIQDVDITNTTDFDINPNNPKKNIKPGGCPGNKKFLNFEIVNINPACTTASTLVTVEIKNQADFTFTLEVISSPEIYVLGGNPSADIYYNSTVTSDANGTYFGEVDEGQVVTRTYIVLNVGTCYLDISALSSSNPDFAVTSTFSIPYINLSPYDYITVDVSFTAPVAGIGTQTSTISIDNTDNTVFNFDVSAEMFNENIPGPGGITADFRLWLKTTRGITKTGTKVSLWEDLGTNSKDAEQPTPANQPTYLDDVTSNINFNPVLQFENDGAGTEQFMYNVTNGFYSHDIFIVMISDATMTSASPRNTIFAGVSSGNANDITGVGFGDYSSEFLNEVLSYNQDVEAGGSFNGVAEIGTTYSNAGIINVRNDADPVNTQELLYNSQLLTTSSVDDIAYDNVGYVGPSPDFTVFGTEFWIGKNFDQQGSLNGRVAEIFTFAERVTDTGRQKIESYLAIKYGITLGSSNEAQKNYINSFDNLIWDISANSGYNYDVAGIGRDSISDLNQKQSKTINSVNGVTIGLGGIYATNSANSNEFEDDGDFLVWGNNNGALSGTNTNTITIATGITTSVTRIDRKWKIVESTVAVDADIETVFVGIPETAFSGFSKTADEEYALIVADNSAFANGDIIDVIPLTINVDSATGNPILDQNGNQVYKTWYNFHETKYFTFGKVPRFVEKHSIKIGSGDYLVGEIPMNLNANAFSVSAWVKSIPSANTRTIMAKGSKLQLRLNASNQVEVTLDDLATAKFTSIITIIDSKWHQITFVYKSGTIFIYIDGVLDHSEQDIVPPSPNYNHFSVGAIYDSKSSITNPFLGEIDEVYIWNQALTENQVRYLMNQEVERFDDSGTDYVSGKVLPRNASSNEVASIPWSDLEVYYNFNCFHGSTVEGLSDSRQFLRLKHLNKDKALVDDQTAPLPYVTVADGAWDNPGIWSNSADQMTPNSLSLDGVTQIDWNTVELNHNISSGERDISLLGLKNNSGIITIADPNETLDETNSGQALVVTNYLEIDGVIDLVGESQLIQTEGSVLDEDSGGFIERDQQGTANSFNYNYWSSSVGPISGNSLTRGSGVSSTNANQTISGVLLDGTTSSAYQNITFNPSHAAADSGPSNPIVKSAYWLYKFYGANDNYYSWASIDETSSLLPGEGFTMKGSSGATDILNDFQNYVFKGKPNNGDILLSLDKNVTAQNPSGNVDRLVGNPYPSAIDATEFILDNLSIADGGNNINGTIFNGALYFWDHFGEENSHNLGNYVGGYATRNLIAGAAAISDDARINNTSNAGGPAIGTKVPGPYIPVNQGFFVTTALNGFDNNNETPITTVDGGDIVFENGQRVFVREATSSSVFMRSSSSSSNMDSEPNNKPLLRLRFDSPIGLHRQIVLGTDDSASLGFDLGYDALMADVNQEDMYWVLEQERFVIQGVNELNFGQEFPLGLIIKESGLARIQVDDIENIDPNTEIYINDNASGEQFEIRNEPFEINLEAGTYNDRFTLVFSSQTSEEETLSTEELTLDEEDIIVYYNSPMSELTIRVASNVSIMDVTLNNALGQRIQTLDFSSDNNTVQLYVNTGVYILRIKTSIGSLNKKIIIK